MADSKSPIVWKGIVPDCLDYSRYQNTSTYIYDPLRYIKDTPNENLLDPPTPMEFTMCGEVRNSLSWMQTSNDGRLDIGALYIKEVEKLWSTVVGGSMSKNELATNLTVHNYFLNYPLSRIYTITVDDSNASNTGTHLHWKEISESFPGVSFKNKTELANKIKSIVEEVISDIEALEKNTIVVKLLKMLVNEEMKVIEVIVLMVEQAYALDWVRNNILERFKDQIPKLHEDVSEKSVNQIMKCAYILLSNQQETELEEVLSQDCGIRINYVKPDQITEAVQEKSTLDAFKECLKIVQTTQKNSEMWYKLFPNMLEAMRDYSTSFKIAHLLAEVFPHTGDTLSREYSDFLNVPSFTVFYEKEASASPHEKYMSRVSKWLEAKCEGTDESSDIIQSESSIRRSVDHRGELTVASSQPSQQQREMTPLQRLSPTLSTYTSFSENQTLYSQISNPNIPDGFRFSSEHFPEPRDIPKIPTGPSEMELQLRELTYKVPEPSPQRKIKITEDLYHYIINPYNQTSLCHYFRGLLKDKALLLPQDIFHELTQARKLARLGNDKSKGKWTKERPKWYQMHQEKSKRVQK